MRKLTQKELLEELARAFDSESVAYKQIREHISLSHALPEVLAELGKELAVDQMFISKWWIKFKEWQIGQHPGRLSSFLREMLKEAGVEVIPKK